MNEILLGKKGVVTMGDSLRKKDRTSQIPTKSEEIRQFLKEKFIRPLMMINPDAISALLAYLAYESSPPLIHDYFCDDGTLKKDKFISDTSKKEGIGGIYNILEKLVKQSREEQHEFREQAR